MANNKMDIETTKTLRFEIETAKNTLSNIMLVIERQAIPIAKELYKENFEPSQKLNKSFETLLSTAENQHDRLSKLMILLDNKPKTKEITKLLDKTKSKGQKFLESLQITTKTLGKYILLTKTKPNTTGLHASCKTCEDILSDLIHKLQNDMDSIINT